MEWTGRGESTYKEDRIAIDLLILFRYSENHSQFYFNRLELSQEDD
jgi:hypothetical protein